tara:strand:+ start:3743 stop:4288 length:546 start_codon:yes stop_codon:yes gene_type:complete
MRFAALISIVVISIASPVTLGHGANDFSIIMRGSIMQPTQADVLQNDTLTFYNVADHNRTIRVDLDGDGNYDQRCDTEARNSSSIKDQCTFVIDASGWSAGEYKMDVFSNGTLWGVLNLTVIQDSHEELGPPSGYSFNSGNESETDGLRSDSSSQRDLFGLAIVLLIFSALTWVSGRSSSE